MFYCRTALWVACQRQIRWQTYGVYFQYCIKQDIFDRFWILLLNFHYFLNGHNKFGIVILKEDELKEVIDSNAYKVWARAKIQKTELT